MSGGVSYAAVTAVALMMAPVTGTVEPPFRVAGSEVPSYLPPDSEFARVVRSGPYAGTRLKPGPQRRLECLFAGSPESIPLPDGEYDIRQGYATYTMTVRDGRNAGIANLRQ